MKKKLLILSSLLLLGACSNSMNSEKPTNIVGGVTHAKLDTRGEKALAFLVEKEGYKGKPFEVISYRKQVVAGMNHYFTIAIGDKIYNNIVFESLNGDYSITK